MRLPHFFKAYCRIGIQNLPYGQSSSAKGVEEAPDFILSSSFLKKFPKSKLGNFNFPQPEKINTSKYFQTINKQYTDFSNKLIKNVNKNDTLIVVGGDHSITFASLLYDLKTYGNDIGIIHFDSHGDICLYKKSPSKNFHGMYLRILFDKFDLLYFDKLVRKKLSKKNLLFIGDLEIDDEEKDFIKNNFQTYSHSQIEKNKKQSLDEIQKFIYKFPHIHVSFDVDVFKKDLVTATGTPSKNGFNKKEIFGILKIVKKAKSLTLDVAEVNPHKKGAAKTIKLAQEIILEVLS